MSEVHRRVAADGYYYEIAYSIRADGQSEPGWALMEELANERWPDGTRSDSHQPSLRRKLLAIILYLAENGEIDKRSSYNSLGEGMWELKVEDIRLTFYDTDGHGSWEPKVGEPISVMGKTEWLLPEDFEDYIRLGHSFPKTSQRTSLADMTEAHEVRKEDIEHDRIVPATLAD